MQDSRPTSRAIAALAVVAAFTVAAPVAASAPPGRLFTHGYDKCKAATLAAVSKAAGVPIAKARFDGKTCTWSSKDGSVVILFDTHPTGYLEYMAPKVGKASNGDVTRAVKVPGATKAVLETHAYALTHRHQKDLFAGYAPGVVQLSMDYGSALSDARVVAVLRMLTHT